MLSKEEIEKAKEDLKNLYVMLNPKPSTSTNAIKTILQYIAQLEQENNKQNKMMDEMGYLLFGLPILDTKKS